jgi:hypothetical protein
LLADWPFSERRETDTSDLEVSHAKEDWEDQEEGKKTTNAGDHMPYCQPKTCENDPKEIGKARSGNPLFSDQLRIHQFFPKWESSETRDSKRCHTEWYANDRAAEKQA